MKKRISAIFSILLVSSFSLTGCTNTLNPDKVIKSPDTKIVDFEIVDSNYWSVILVDKNTNVMYFWCMSNDGGITPIYNADGSLKLYEEDE